MAASPSSDQSAEIAADVRQRLVAEVSNAMGPLLVLVQERLTALLDEAAPSREMQLRRDVWTLYQRNKVAWRDGTLRAWQAALKPAPRAKRLSLDGAFELVGTDVVENRIIASRLALGVMEKAAGEVNDLRKRLKSLNNNQELSPQDIVHPETLALPLVEQWGLSGLSRESWLLINDVVLHYLTQQLQKSYTKFNVELVDQGILPVIEFGARPNAGSAVNDPSEEGESESQNVAQGRSEQRPRAGAVALVAQRRADETTSRAQSGSAYSGANMGAGGSAGMGGTAGAGFAGGGNASAGYSGTDGSASGGFLNLGAGGGRGRDSRAVRQSQALGGRVHEMLTRVTRLLTGSAAQTKFAETVYQAPSETLMAALAQQPRLGDDYFNQAVRMESPSPMVIERVASELRQQSAELKDQAQNDSEKAIIELVALMFQSILQEDRIPTGIRVWFARLQMPVLRVALAEPDFFNKLDHPARQLIDHMGSCVMGFDASGISSAALETEIKRVVQVVEQYPETGDRVYRRVYDEFLEFLKKHLTQKSSTQKVMGVAQQLEQKETLTIQYTIELRNLLKDMPVRDEIREFLFKVWAEVLAVSAVRQGAQHEETLLLKKTATDLIWAASAKPNRADRARVISDLPELLQCLRLGMGMLGVIKSAQEAHIKVISDILADAFMSKTQAIDVGQIKALAARLANLEDYVSDDGTEELPLDSQNIEELLGIEASDLDVITSGGGGNASAVMMEWARDLDLGSWFMLDHNARIAQVQYVWRSPLGHLHLFASAVGRSYLIQTVRLAAYLQAGLLQPQEEESLTVRATRDAVGKIEANPERLLG